MTKPHIIPLQHAIDVSLISHSGGWDTTCNEYVDILADVDSLREMGFLHDDIDVHEELRFGRVLFELTMSLCASEIRDGRGYMVRYVLCAFVVCISFQTRAALRPLAHLYCI